MFAIARGKDSPNLTPLVLPGPGYLVNKAGQGLAENQERIQGLDLNAVRGQIPDREAADVLGQECVSVTTNRGSSVRVVIRIWPSEVLQPWRVVHWVGIDPKA